MTTTMSKEEKEKLERDFTYHAPNEEQIKKYGSLRKLGKELAEEIFFQCPASRERDIAYEAVSEAIMWANASIARNEE